MNQITMTLDEKVENIPAALKQLQKIHGVSAVIQVFPDDEDQELVRYVVLNLSGPANPEQVLELVKETGLAEIAELTPARKAQAQ